MEPEGSSPHTQEHVTCPYPEPDPSIPFLPMSLLEDLFHYNPPINAWVFRVVSPPQVSPPKPSTFLSCPSYVPHALLISSS